MCFKNIYISAIIHNVDPCDCNGCLLGNALRYRISPELRAHPASLTMRKSNAPSAMMKVPVFRTPFVVSKAVTVSSDLIYGKGSVESRDSVCAANPSNVTHFNSRLAMQREYSDMY